MVDQSLRDGEMMEDAACSVSEHLENEEEPPPPKKAKLDRPGDAQPKKLLGLVDHHGEPQALPADWVAVPHVSGATVYLHQPTRVVTFSRPYQVPTSKTIRKHSACVQSIPCLEQWLFAEGQRSELALTWHRQQGEGAPRNSSLVKIGPERLREYLALRWDSSLLMEAGCRSALREEGRGEKEKEGEGEGDKRKKKTPQKTKPVIPKGLSKVVKVKVPPEYRNIVKHPEGRTPPAVWEVNLATKNATTVLHEFCQLYFHTSPSFSFSDTKGPPYCCEVKVGGVNYGSGKAVNKRVAKVTAAAEAVEVFLPGAFPSHILLPTDDIAGRHSRSSLSTLSEEGLQLLSGLAVEDPDAPSVLARTGFPSPWQTLKNSLIWNKGLLLSDKLSLDLRPLSDSQSHASSSSVPSNHHFDCVLRCGEEGGEGKGVVEVRVTCVGRKDGQQAAAQAMLKKFHPFVTNWGSLLKLYSRTPPPSPRQLELPPSSVAEGCGLLSEADQKLLHRLRESMFQLSRERGGRERGGIGDGEKKTTEVDGGQAQEKVTAAYLHQTHLCLLQQDSSYSHH